MFAWHIEKEWKFFFKMKNLYSKLTLLLVFGKEKYCSHKTNLFIIFNLQSVGVNILSSIVLRDVLAYLICRGCPRDSLL
jgi:hypothetical protein